MRSCSRLRAAACCLERTGLIVLRSAAGEPNKTLVEHLAQTKGTVGKWRRRFIERRIPGLFDDV